MKAKDVKYVFEQNPELRDIGTKTQYYKYLKTIFPESKVDDVVYHGSKKSGIEKFDTVSNWTPKGNSRFRVKQEESKGLYLTRDKDFIEEFAKNNIVNEIYSILVDIKSPKYKEGIVNSNDIAIERVVKMQPKYDSIISDEGGEKNTIIAFEPNQIHILGSKKDKEGFKEFVSEHQGNALEKSVLTSIFAFFTIAGLLFSTNQLTGNVIGTSTSTLNFAWPVLAVLGFCGIYISRRYKK